MPVTDPSAKASRNIKRLVREKLRESLITMALAAKLELKALESSEVSRLPNIPRGPHNPGLRIPYFDLTGELLVLMDPETSRKIPMYRVRYLPPRRVNDSGKAAGNGSREQKYTQPLRAGCPPYLPPLADWAALAADPEKELWITEGELKAIAATRFGPPTMGLGGVWNFKGQERPLTDLLYQFIWKERPVVCPYDSDFTTNHNVRYAADSFARALTREGAKVHILIIPSLPGLKKTGLDDFLRLGAQSPKEALALLRERITPWVDGTMNDTGNANIFVDLHGDRLFYAREERSWRFWDGKAWVANRTHEALSFTESVSAQLQAEASTLQDAEAKGKALRWATMSGNEAKRQAMLTLAETKLVKDADCLDRDPLLFNCQNGILDLSKAPFRLLPHDPTKMQGRISPVLYDLAARCPEFERFLKRIVPKLRIREFLQRLAGYALTGKTGEHCFFIFYGTGRNGKSTLIETLMYVWGTYARSANGDTFLSGRRPGTIRDDLHALRGARLVKAVETGKNARLDEEAVKEHTGGDTITTRALYGQQTEWKPVHKLILVSNDKPHIEGTDEGIWSRVRMVPFTEVIPEAERIPDYFEKKLEAEASGILHWALEGLRQYMKRGLSAPEEVREATQEYRSEENIVQQFLDAQCTIDFYAQPSPDGNQCWSTPVELQSAFRDFCISQGIRFHRLKLKQTLEQMGFRQERTHSNRYWCGIVTTGKLSCIPPKYRKSR
jgi:P4 family phage/plasmid primase-like protien